MLPLDITSAKLADFCMPTPRLLFGEHLKSVKEIQTSISAHGLLNPLIVMRRGRQLIVVDGKKRLAALRRMKFAGNLPRSLVNVPYILISQQNDFKLKAMSLLSNQERYEEVLKLRQQGLTLTEIAANLYITKQCVKDLLQIAMLSPRLRQAYFSGTISFAQAKAFATLPNIETQDQLLITLGPFAKAPDILKAIENGETVLTVDHDNVIVLPSRRPLTPMKYAA